MRLWFIIIIIIILGFGQRLNRNSHWDVQRTRIMNILPNIPSGLRGLTFVQEQHTHHWTVDGVQRNNLDRHGLF